MNDRLNGIILKGIGGFYYVEAADVLYECKARGAFRKEKISPLPGDRVEITINPQGENTIESILPRKNVLVRPPLANLDQLFIVSSMSQPRPNTLIIDKVIAIAELHHIEPIILFTKSDLEDSGALVRVYQNAGFQSFSISLEKQDNLDSIRSLLGGKISAFTGNTGVGKSTLLNRIDEKLELATGEISRKLGRGKHTTRHVELFPVSAGGYVADTPGFSSVEIEIGEKIFKEDLFDCFREFHKYYGQCKFTSCTHIHDKGCAVAAAVEAGDIEKSRHESYIAMYNEVKDLKRWEV